MIDLRSSREIRRGQGANAELLRVAEIAQVVGHDELATTSHGGFQNHVISGVRQKRAPEVEHLCPVRLRTQVIENRINVL
jgi:hypothetical protein